LADDAMNENSLLAFAVTAAIIELTPGPNMGYLSILLVLVGGRFLYSTRRGMP
jgi:threonine/homoserine/homoserine lactone efflux protein